MVDRRSKSTPKPTISPWIPRRKERRLVSLSQRQRVSPQKAKPREVPAADKKGSADRNKASQQDALRRYMTRGYKSTKSKTLFSDIVVLEVASGFGEAISYFANCHPDVIFAPTDPQQPCLERLRDVAKSHENLMDPMELNIFRPSQWDRIAKTGGPYDGILCFNLIHLIPWNGTFTLLKYASQLLEEERGFFALHGPFLREGTFMSLSDRDFDEDIKSRDEEWGLRDLETVIRIAGDYQFRKEEIREMRAGNWLLILRRQ